MYFIYFFNYISAYIEHNANISLEYYMAKY